MVLQFKRLNVEEFEEFIEQPENADKLFEYIGGEVYEVPSNPYASMVGYIIGIAMGIYLKGNNIGRITGEAGGYWVSGERYAPDVAFIAHNKPLVKSGYNTIPPDLVVEVDFPSTLESQRRLRVKIVNYLAAGTVVWAVYPETQRVEVYVPGQPVKILGIDDLLDGGDILPGFSLPVREIFPE